MTDTRSPSGSLPTNRKFTGQIEEASLGGIYFYNARWLDTALGRFLQADTIVPSPGNPLDWDRYAYVRNGPVNYTDPSGHAQVCAQGDLGGGCGSDGTNYYIRSKERSKILETGPQKVYPYQEGYWDLWSNKWFPNLMLYNVDRDLDSILGFLDNLILPVVEGVGDYTGLYRIEGRVGFGIDAILQLANDRHSDLNARQKIGRATLIGVEGAVTGYASTSLASMYALAAIEPSCHIAAQTGQTWIVPTWVGGGWVATYGLTNNIMTQTFDRFNTFVFPIIGFGDYQ